MKRTDVERLEIIVALWETLREELVQRGISKDMLLSDQFSQWAVTTPIDNIGEQVYQITAQFKKEHPDIPWSMVSGLRHRLVHDYEGINWSVVADVICCDMPVFVERIKGLCACGSSYPGEDDVKKETE